MHYYRHALRETVHQAWEVLNQHPGLKWYGMISSFFGLFWGLAHLGYQGVAFWNMYAAHTMEKSYLERMSANLGLLKSFVFDHPDLIVGLIVLAVIVLAGHFVLNPILEGGLISLVGSILNGEKPRLIKGLPLGVLYIFPLMEFEFITAYFSVSVLLFELFWAVRNFGWGAFGFVMIPIAVLGLAGLVISFLFTYARFFIVLESKNVISAVIQSVKLVIFNLEQTVVLLLLTLLIVIRILLNVILVVVVPGIVIALIVGLSSSFLKTTGVVIGGALGLLLFLAVTYLSGIVHVFTTIAWTILFKELTKKGLKGWIMERVAGE